MKERIKKIKGKEITLGVILGLLIMIVILTLRDTHAYYGVSNELPILEATVGNVREKYLKGNYDINIVFYMEDGEGSNNYKIEENVPVTGYLINQEKSNCEPKEGEASYSDYTIKEDGTLSLTVQEDNAKRITCSIYYSKIEGSDIVTYALVEDEEGTISYKEKKYKIVNKIPDESYTYFESSCEKNIDTEVIYNQEEKQFSFKTKGPNTCYAYFNKKGE